MRAGCDGVSMSAWFVGVTLRTWFVGVTMRTWFVGVTMRTWFVGVTMRLWCVDITRRSWHNGVTITLCGVGVTMSLWCDGVGVSLWCDGVSMSLWCVGVTISLCFDFVTWGHVDTMRSWYDGVTLKVYDLLALPEGAAEFLVVHGGAVFLGAPHVCHLVRLDDAEDPLGAVLPLDQLRAVSRVVQQVEQELPQVVTLGYCNHRNNETWLIQT